MRLIATKDIATIPNKEYAAYARHFMEQHSNFAHTMSSFGVPVSTNILSPDRLKTLRQKLKQAGAHFRNGDKSIVYGALSPACERCRTGVKSVS